MQAIVADNERKISQYQSEASHYATQVNQYIQNYTSRLQKDMQDTQATIANNDDLVAKYQSELQQYTSEVQAETAEYQNKIQKQQAYSKEADKYYQWANLEVKTYIQNNSKMIAATMSSRSQSAQA
jgi:ABC-type transporter Mla subunit MlaD